jgi:O-Antigen ligase
VRRAGLRFHDLCLHMKMGALQRVTALRKQTGKKTLAARTSGSEGSRGLAGPAIARWMLNATLFCFGVVAALGQWFPGDSASIVMGQTLPQIGLWCILAVAVAVFSFLVPRKSTIWSMTSCVLGGGLLVWIALSTWMVQGRGNVRFALNMFWQWVAFGLVFAASLWIARRLNRRSHLIVFFLGLSIVTSFHAIYQYAYSMPRDRLRYKENPEEVLRELGLDAQTGSATRLRWEDRLQSTEPIGPYALTNSLAGFLAPCVLLLGAVLLESRSWKHWRWPRLAVVVALCLSLVVLALTKSRTAWLATFAGAVLYGAMHPASRMHFRRHMKKYILGGASVAAVAAIWVLAVDSRILTEAPKSLAFRWQYWQSTLVLISHNVLFGVGPGNFQDYYATYKLPNSSETVLDPHSFLLETIATGGVMAGVLLLAWLAWIVLAWWRTDRLEQRGAVDAETPSTNYAVPLALGVMVAGFVWLIFPQVVGMGPDPYPYLVGIPLALLWVWVIGRAFVESDISSRAVVCAFAVGVINLSASGGWLAPGITNILAAFAGIILGGVPDLANKPAESSSDRIPESHAREKMLGWALRVSAVAIGLLLLFGFLKSCWEPVQLASAVSNKPVVSLDQARRNAQEAAQLDPWNPAHRAALVGLSFMELEKEAREGKPVDGVLHKVESAVNDLLQADPHSWRADFEIGRQSLGLVASVPKMAEMAKEHFMRAAELSPQDASCHLQAALSCWLIGNKECAKTELEAALRINQQTPHRDQKLASLLIWWPENVGPRSETKIGVEWKQVGRDVSLKAGWVRAEPVAIMLRNELD